MHAQKVRPRVEKHDSDVFMDLKGEPEGRVEDIACLITITHQHKRDWRDMRARVRTSPLLQKGSRPLPGSAGPFGDRPPQPNADLSGDVKVVGGSRIFSRLSHFCHVCPVWTGHQSGLQCFLPHSQSVCLAVWSGPLEVILGSGSDISGLATGLLLSYDLLHLFPMYWLVSLLHHISLHLLAKVAKSQQEWRGEEISENFTKI